MLYISNGFPLVWFLMYRHSMSVCFTSDFKFWVRVNGHSQVNSAHYFWLSLPYKFCECINFMGTVSIWCVLLCTRSILQLDEDWSVDFILVGIATYNIHLLQFKIQGPRSFAKKGSLKKNWLKSPKLWRF